VLFQGPLDPLAPLAVFRRSIQWNIQPAHAS
jgi:hypothetical protein